MSTLSPKVGFDVSDQKVDGCDSFLTSAMRDLWTLEAPGFETTEASPAVAGAIRQRPENIPARDDAG